MLETNRFLPVLVVAVLAACSPSRVSAPPNGSVARPPVVAAFTATPATISAGGTSTLTWSVTGADALSIEGIGTVTGTSREVSPAASSLYTLTATNASGQVSATAAVDVTGGTWQLPVERATLWQPGVTYNGGIPHRTTLCATLSPRGGGQDDTAAIQAAIDSCPAGQVVKLAAGTFTLAGRPNGAIFLTRSNITLRGTVDANGEPATVLTYPQDDGQMGAIITVGTLWYHWDDASSVNVSADVAKESRTVTVASSRGYQVGELVLVDETTDDQLTWWAPRCSPGGADYPDCRLWFIRSDRPVGQINEIAAVSADGKTLTFSAPFHTPFRTAKAAQVTRILQTDGYMPTTRSGVEDLKVSGGGQGDGGGNIHVDAASYCWLRNVEADRSSGTSINFDGSFRCELRDSYVHSTLDPNPGGAGYGIGFNTYAADNLVENSISWNFNKVMLMRASGGGNVVAYSYMEDGWGAGYPCIVESGLNASHYSTAHMELFEGNRSFNFSSDYTWGNSVYVTAFRNWLTGLRGAYPPLDSYWLGQLAYEDVNDRYAIAVGAYHYWSTFVGNVLGHAGQTLISDPRTVGQGIQERFTYEASGDTTANVPMWRIALKDDGTQEPKTVSTLLRHGNYDFVTASVKWNADPAMSHELPASLYTTSKPAFMGSNPWPWVDPLSGATYVLPAKARFDRLHGVR